MLRFTLVQCDMLYRFMFHAFLALKVFNRKLKGYYKLHQKHRILIDIKEVLTLF